MLDSDVDVLLGGYASKQCARRVHNDHDRTIPKMRREPPPELQARFDAGIAFEVAVFDAMESALGRRCTRLADLHDQAWTTKTMAAMTRGDDVILGGQLPADVAGGRVGRPDILVRWSKVGEPPTYLPADVKHHRTAKPSQRKHLRVSALASPSQIVDLPELVEEVSGRFDDFMQLAHYTRMLQACGFHPGADVALGAIIGTDDLLVVDSSGYAFVWHDLSTPLFTTYSRELGKRKRSALERYDHEHDFRVQVAAVASRRTGSDTDPAPLVVPIWQQECDLCPWRDYCAATLGPEAPSMAITSGRLDVREWLALAEAGVSTTVALADLDPDSPTFQGAYLPLVRHQAAALARLRCAIERAQMIRDGESLRRTTTGPLTVPSADVEIDFDIEWDVDDHVYLWGARVRRGGEATYHPFVSWEVLDESTEKDLAVSFVAWLRETVVAADELGESVAVFHYSTPEPNYLKKVLGEEAVADLLPLFVDLLPLLRANFMGVHGLGIKKVAPAFGFNWRDDDPGGLQSQGWLLDARSGADEPVRLAARQRLLRYNEDDVAATAAIRDGMADERGAGERDG